MAQLFGERMGAPMADTHPSLKAWRARMSARPAVRKVAGAMGRYLLTQGRKLPAFLARAECMTRILFLPGAGASPDFWKPVGDRLPKAWPKDVRLAGLGDQPHDPAIQGIDDLVRLVGARDG